MIFKLLIIDVSKNDFIDSYLEGIHYRWGSKYIDFAHRYAIQSGPIISQVLFSYKFNKKFMNFKKL